VSLPPLVCLVGPTAVGKTEAALRLAERLGAEIVSADSRLLYRGMDIGTAKPSPEERRRVPHHLVDVAEPDETWSLEQVRGAVLHAVGEITARGRLPLMVGGTGQYVRAILEGWEPPPRADDPAVRLRLEAFAREVGPDALHARLLQVDPSSAARIDARNVRRVVRALEIHEVTGQPASTQRRRQPPPYRILRLGLTAPRPVLYARIDNRIDQMLERGWVDEVRGLLEQGFDPGLPSFSAIGYPQIVEVVQERRSLDEAKSEIRRRTRVLVRRQANWFKPDDRSIAWFEYQAGVAEEMEAEVRRWLAAAAD
jgi:tRNA dimethylallyltransferase